MTETNYISSPLVWNAYFTLKAIMHSEYFFLTCPRQHVADSIGSPKVPIRWARRVWWNSRSVPDRHTVGSGLLIITLYNELCAEGDAIVCFALVWRLQLTYISINNITIMDWATLPGHYFGWETGDFNRKSHILPTKVQFILSSSLLLFVFIIFFFFVWLNLKRCCIHV